MLLSQGYFGPLWVMLRAFRLFGSILRLCLRRTEHVFREKSQTYSNEIETKKLMMENGKEGGIRYIYLNSS